MIVIKVISRTIGSKLDSDWVSRTTEWVPKQSLVNENSFEWISKQKNVKPETQYCSFAHTLTRTHVHTWNQEPRI